MPKYKVYFERRESLYGIVEAEDEESALQIAKDEAIDLVDEEQGTIGTTGEVEEIEEDNGNN